MVPPRRITSRIGNNSNSSNSSSNSNTNSNSNSNSNKNKNNKRTMRACRFFFLSGCSLLSCVWADGGCLAPVAA